jgi:hypothetical protein
MKSIVTGNTGLGRESCIRHRQSKILRCAPAMKAGSSKKSLAVRSYSQAALIFKFVAIKKAFKDDEEEGYKLTPTALMPGNNRSGQA